MTEIVNAAASDRRRNWGLGMLAGGGMAMTAFASAALLILYIRNAPLAFVFYMGLAALGLVGIVLTGFSALLVKRTFRVGRDGVGVFRYGRRVVMMLNPFDWPRWAQMALGGIAAAILFMVAKGFYDRSVINEHEAEIAAEIRALESEAGIRAAEAANQTRNDVEKSNAQARDAAARSDDPLGDGLRSLRP